MNTNMQGHNHGGKNHLLWMLGIAGVVLVILLGTGRSLGQALPYALLLAWNLVDEMRTQHAGWLASGGRFIVPIPHPEILP